MPRRIATFRGAVSCRRDPDNPLGLVLVGHTIDHPRELVWVAFACAAPADFPDVIEDAEVECIEAGRCRISSPPREWVLEARSAHVHRDVGSLFYQVIAPRQAPWSKRLFWRIVLALAANPLGKRVLLALRR